MQILKLLSLFVARIHDDTMAYDKIPLSSLSCAIFPEAMDFQYSMSLD